MVISYSIFWDQYYLNIERVILIAEAFRDEPLEDGRLPVGPGRVVDGRAVDEHLHRRAVAAASAWQSKGLLINDRYLCLASLQIICK